ncbi:MAG TPA: MMPL family transporter [Mycobacteriales bacterium]|jgi:RND superfamily putative drug exporter|nr:MMPL family transporter [Mycobacteriales bacterium]
MNRLVRRIGDLSARRPWTTLGGWAVLAALVVALAGSVGGAFLDNFTAPKSESARATALLQERFPAVAGGSGVLVFTAPDGSRLADVRTAVEQTLSRVAAVEHVAGVSDPFRDGQVSADGRIGAAAITLDVPSTEFGKAPAAAVAAALEPARAGGLTAEFGGEAATLNAAKASGGEAFGLLAALVVLVVAFGTVAAALVPIVVALVAVGCGLGGIVVLAGALDVSTAAPVFGAMVGLGVGIDYSLFIVSRYRDNRAAGQDNAQALSAAMATSGTAVFFAGGTVVVSMTALVLTGVGFLATIGLATSVVVLFAVATAVTLLPALLSLLGDRIDAGRLLRRQRTVDTGAFWKLAHRIAGRPWPYLGAASLLLLLLAAPALSLQTGFPNAGDSPTNTSERRAYDLLAEGFGPGANAPLLVVADLQDTGLTAADVPALAQRLATDPGIASVGRPQVSPDGGTVTLSAVPRTSPADPATARTLQRIRAGAPQGLYLTGPTALTLDLDEQLGNTLPLFLGAILAVSILLLMVVFRSVAVPLKAAVMNLLSIAGAYGVVVAVFQWGWLGGLFGLEQTYLIASPFPLLFFAVLFGLSMDYEVFLVSRIREAYLATGDNAESVARGLAATGRVISSGALIMVVVFLSFVSDPDPFVKMIGLGLAVAVALDATLVRMILVPATMAVMGRANWWLPSWLDRLLPHMRLEAGALDGGATAAAPVPAPRPPAVSAGVPAGR